MKLCGEEGKGKEGIEVRGRLGVGSTRARSSVARSW